MQRDVFQAIADPTRRAIIDLLADQQLSVNEVAGNFEMSRPAVSKHLKILDECGLVIIRKERRKPAAGSPLCMCWTRNGKPIPNVHKRAGSICWTN